MLTDKQMTTLRKIAQRLRELKPYLNKIAGEVNEQRTLLPERHWRNQIDDEMIGITVALDFAESEINDAINHIAEVTGESEDPDTPRPKYAPLPRKLPTHEELDMQRRTDAAAILKRRG